MKKFILLLLIISSCATRPPISNKPRYLTLAKYRVGDLVNLSETKYKDCSARILNIIDDSSDSYWYQLSIGCSSEKIIKIIPQVYLDNLKGEE